MKNRSMLFNLYCISILRSDFCELQCVYFLFYINFNISRYQFSRLFRLYSTLSEKDFRRKFSFLNRFTQLHIFDPLKGQNLLSVTKFFCQVSLRCSLKHFFFKNLLTKLFKSIFYAQPLYFQIRF